MLNNFFSSTFLFDLMSIFKNTFQSTEIIQKTCSSFGPYALQVKVSKKAKENDFLRSLVTYPLLPEYYHLNHLQEPEGHPV